MSLVWRSVLFVARRATRPIGASVCQRHTQGFALQGKADCHGFLTHLGGATGTALLLWMLLDGNHFPLPCFILFQIPEGWDLPASAKSSALGIVSLFGIVCPHSAIGTVKMCGPQLQRMFLGHGTPFRFGGIPFQQAVFFFQLCHFRQTFPSFPLADRSHGNWASLRQNDSMYARL